MGPACARPVADRPSTWPQKDALTDKLVMHQAVVLGLGSMFNHSRLRQNVGWKRDVDAGVIMYTTLCDIEVNCQYLLLVPVF